LLHKKLVGKSASSWLLSCSAVIPLRLRGIFLRKLDKVIVPSKYVKRRLFENTELIRAGVDTEKFRPTEGTKRKAKIKIGFFGHAGIPKGAVDLATASKKFPKEAKVYIFFTRRYKKLEKYLKNKNPKIKIFGQIDKISEVYKKMDLIVLPYRTPLSVIANPLVLLEAMAMEKAIVTTNLGFIKEIVKDSVIMVKPYSPEEIIKAVNKLIKDEKLRKKLGEKARQIVTKNYNQKCMFKAYLELYQEFEKDLRK